MASLSFRNKATFIGKVIECFEHDYRNPYRKTYLQYGITLENKFGRVSGVMVKKILKSDTRLLIGPPKEEFYKKAIGEIQYDAKTKRNLFVIHFLEDITKDEYEKRAARNTSDFSSLHKLKGSECQQELNAFLLNQNHIVGRVHSKKKDTLLLFSEVRTPLTNNSYKVYNKVIVSSDKDKSLLSVLEYDDFVAVWGAMYEDKKGSIYVTPTEMKKYYGQVFTSDIDMLLK